MINIEIIDLRKSYRLDGRGKYTIRFGSGYYDPLKHKYHDKPISTISFTFWWRLFVEIQQSLQAGLIVIASAMATGV